jgi:hypothetical protein
VLQAFQSRTYESECIDIVHVTFGRHLGYKP